MDAKPASCPASKGRPAPSRSGRIVIRRKRAVPRPSIRQPASGEQAVVSDFPAAMPVLRDEVAILRAYLGREIDAILFDQK